MPLQTTVIGAWPKPPWLNVGDWFFKSDENGAVHRSDLYSKLKAEAGDEWEPRIDRALTEVIKQQEQLGVDVITDGEVSRDVYIYSFCRQLQGIDVDNPVFKVYRGGATSGYMPAITAKIEPQFLKPGEESESVREWRKAQTLTQKTVKYTLPGPLTIYGSSEDQFYHDAEAACIDLAACLRREVAALVNAGCKHVQIDEPVLMREPERAKRFAIRLLGDIVQDLPSDVTTTTHLCCGYPMYLDQENYAKADNTLYAELAPLLDNTPFTQVSIEDTHERIKDLGAVLQHFKTTSVVLGSVAIAKSHVESVEEIRERLAHALQFIPSERLIVAPDCGLGFLPLDIAQEKVTNMVQAAKTVKAL